MSQPVTPPPDTVDWAEVLSRPCAECGFVASALVRERFSTLIEERAGGVAARLARPGASERPEPTTWSPVEYARHLADVCDVMTSRLGAIIAADGAGATFAVWDGDEAALAAEYWLTVPDDAAVLLRQRAAEAAAAWAALAQDQWAWEGRRGDGFVFSAESLGAYLIHELVHHGADVGA
ncbi:MAG: DinB family protein [Tessaracoccus sp.]|uniref:DinB family protein n=1 Tax=Tessaracoccus sp. TaxID=1971211 RepID=UPI001EC08CD3|nr:DinB family protein [Tessaracoccus sp.]MBK7822494.1 DinB family protein [Tessaracoccus sp.]